MSAAADEADLDLPLLLRQIKGLPCERLPVWLMRQAGRYLPEYHEVRKRPDGSTVDFFAAIRDAEMASELTVQPVRRFGVDAAIIYSDILIIPQAMGLECKMVPGGGARQAEHEKKVEAAAAAKAAAEAEGSEGGVACNPVSAGPMRPSFPAPLKEPADLLRLKAQADVDIEAELGWLVASIKRTREKLKVQMVLLVLLVLLVLVLLLLLVLLVLLLLLLLTPLLKAEGFVDVTMIGFTGGPWTLMTYMLGESGGGGGGAFAKAKRWLYVYPDASRYIRIPPVCGFLE